MRMRGEQRRIVDAGKGDIGSGQLLHQRLDVVPGEHGGDRAVGLAAMLEPRRHGGEFLVGAERGIAQYHVCQHAPFAVVLDRDQDVGAVAGLEHAVGRDRRVRETDALERLAPLLVQERNRHPLRHGVEHGDGNLGALAAAAARDECFEDRLVGFEPGGDVDHRDADPRRRFGPAGDRRQAGFRLNQQVVGLALGVGPALAIAGNRAADQPRIVLAQPRYGEAELGERAGLEVLHEHVGLGEHGLEQRLVVGLAEIEHHRLLAAIEPDEMCALAVHDIIVGAGEIALRPLDLDDARTGVGHAAGALRRRHGLLDRDDEDA